MLSRWKERRRHFREFDETGIFHMRRAVEGQIYHQTPGKTEDAVLWVHRYDQWYPRMAVAVSVLSLLASLCALLWAILFRGGCK